MKFLGDLENGMVSVTQQDFSLSYEGAINPILGGGAAGLPDNGAEVALGKAHAFSVVGYLVVLTAMLVDELDEPVEDSLLTRAGDSESVSLLMEQTVVVVHQGSNKAGDCGTMVVWLVYEVPKGVEDVAGRLQILIADRQLEVTHLSVKGRGKLSLREGHGEVGKESNAIDFKVVRKPNWIDDGAWANINECA